MFFLFLFFYDFFFFIRMVPVTKYIKGTTLVRNTYLPITEMKDSQGLLQRIEEEKNDNDKADINITLIHKLVNSTRITTCSLTVSM